MRVIYAGTPDFAVPGLMALKAAGHQIVLVLTQPDRPAGRGMAVAQSAVKRAAGSLDIPVFQPASLKTAEAQAELRQTAPDALVVAAYGLILPQAVLDIPRFGSLNIHASLLPRWRGAAPIHRALLAGDLQTGVCIMQMDAGLDTGPVLLSEAVPIAVDDTTGTLHDKLAMLGGRLIVPALAGVETGALTASPQSREGVTYADKIGKVEARIDWTRSATEIERRIRAFNPFPGATTKLRGADIKVWRAQLVPGSSAEAGAVVHADDHGVIVACGEQGLRLLEMQRAGGKRLAAREFLRGFPIAAGGRFE